MECILSYLSLVNIGINTYLDLRHRKISVICCAAFSLVAVLLRLMLFHQEITDLVISVLPGVFLTLTAVISGGKVGMGDAVFFLALGCAEPVGVVILVMILSMCISALFSLGALALKAVSLNSRIPMMPFIAAAYGMMALVSVCNGGVITMG